MHRICQEISVGLMNSFLPEVWYSLVLGTGLYHTSGRKLFTRSTEMTGQILCNLSFLYNKKRHGRILFFHTCYLFLYSTGYTFFSIICASYTCLTQKINCIHSIHAHTLYLILRQESEAVLCVTARSVRGVSPSFHLKTP